MDIERLRLDELDDFAAWARADGWTVHKGSGAHAALGLSRPGHDVEMHGPQVQFYFFGFLERFSLTHNTVQEITAERRGAELVRAYRANRGHAPRPRLDVSEEARGLALRCLDLLDCINSDQKASRYRLAEIEDAQRDLANVAERLGLAVAGDLKEALRGPGGTP